MYYQADEDKLFRPTHLLCYDKSMDFLLPLGEKIELNKGSILLNPNNVPKYCYYILSGRIIRFSHTVLGEEIIYDSFSDGALLFELEAPLNKKLKTTYKASTDCELLRISPEALIDEISSSRDSLMQFLEYLQVVRLRNYRQARESSVQCVEWQVCKLLLTFAERYGVEYDGKLMIKEKISQETFAKMLNISRNSVVRTFKSLKDLNLMERINGYCVIRSVKLLQQHMDTIDNLTY